MVLHGVHQVLVERRAVGGGAERAVAHPAPGPPGDLRYLGRVQRTRAVAVELEQAREGDVVHVHVQAHADRVGGDQEVDLLVLIQRHLRVAGARAEAPHHHRTAAAAAADQLGDRVYLAGTECHDRAARRQAGQLLRPDMGELAQARPRLDLRLRHQAFEQRADDLGAEEHGFHHAARVQQAVGENVAAVGVGTELNLVHRDELGAAVERHRFHRAGEPARLGGQDLFLPGDEGDVAGALSRHHAVVIFAREQA